MVHSLLLWATLVCLLVGVAEAQYCTITLSGPDLRSNHYGWPVVIAGRDIPTEIVFNAVGITNYNIYYMGAGGCTITCNTPVTTSSTTTFSCLTKCNYPQPPDQVAAYDFNAAQGCDSIMFAAAYEIIQTHVSTNKGCIGDNLKSITIDVTGGAYVYGAGFNYNWNPNTVVYTATGLVSGTGDRIVATGLSPGVSYTLSVDNPNTDVPDSVVTYTVSDPAPLSVTATTSPATCNGAATGSASAAVTGGTSPYSYVWFDSSSNQLSSTTQNLPTVPGGFYSVQVTDSNNCPSVTSYLFISQPSAISLTVTKNDVVCNGASTGTASVVASGGSSSYTSYSWTSGSTTSSASALTAGAYSVTVTDSTGCTGQKSFTITQPAALSLSEVHTNAVCYGAAVGSAVITATGGTSPYTYSWSNGGSSSSKTGLAAGTYTVTVADNAGCPSQQQAVVITQPASALSITMSHTDVQCNGGTTGTASVVASGGTSSYTYSWSNGGSTASVSSLAAGTYTVTVTDSAGCVAKGSVTVVQPAAITTSQSSTPVKCKGEATATATASISGGTMPYTYSWFAGSTALSFSSSTATATGLGAGSYSAQLTDANNCPILALSFTITEPAAALSLSVASRTDVTCNGGSTGAASVIASGGTSPYSYSWSTGGTGASVTGLAAGTHTVTVTDQAGCTARLSVVIVQPAVLSLSVLQTDAACNGAASGSAIAAASGGTSPYTYSWSNGGSSASKTGLAAGTYAVSVTDSVGCTAPQQSVIIGQPVSALSLTMSHTDVLCNGGTTGTASVVASGGTSSYTYSWSGGGSAASKSSLAAGTYTVTVTDSAGCIAKGSVTVVQPAAITTSQSTTSVACNGATTGTATAIISGGTTPYSYSWFEGATALSFPSTTSTATGLGAGSFTAQIADANNCPVSPLSFTITQPTAPLSLAVATHTDAICNGGSTGAASVTASGGTSPYTYLWSTGGTGTSATGLAAGTYTVTVTDHAGCTAQQSVTIGQPGSVLALTMSHTDVLCNGGATGTASVAVSGGAPTYSYSWSNGGGSSSSASGLVAGTYTVTVTDSTGCTAQQSVTVKEPTAITTAQSSTNVLCYGASTGTATAIISGGTKPYSYAWYKGSTALSISIFTATGLGAGSYTAQLTDANNCPISPLSFTITAPTAALSLGVTNVDDATCKGGSSGSAAVVASGGTPSYSYSWSSGGSAAQETGLSAGTYAITVVDNGGCSAQHSFTIASNCSLVVSLPPTTPPASTVPPSPTTSPTGPPSPTTSPSPTGPPSPTTSPSPTGPPSPTTSPSPTGPPSTASPSPTTSPSTVSPTPTTSPNSSTTGLQDNQSNSNSSNSSSRSTKIGVGVGIGLGIPITAAAAGGAFLLSRKKKRETPQV